MSQFDKIMFALSSFAYASVVCFLSIVLSGAGHGLVGCRWLQFAILVIPFTEIVYVYFNKHFKNASVIALICAIVLDVLFLYESSNIYNVAIAAPVQFFALFFLWIAWRMPLCYILIKELLQPRKVKN